MTDFVDLARYYEAHGLYQRERRPFRRRLLRFWKRVPDVRSLRPEPRHEIFGGRTGVLDRVQGVFGYFFGGGWVYGLVENRAFRAYGAGVEAYQSTPPGTALAPLLFRAGRDLSGPREDDAAVPQDKKPKLPKDGYLDVTVARDLLAKPKTYPRLNPEPLPSYSHLRRIDRLALLHDLQLRQRDERVWAGDLVEGSDEYEDLSRDANGALLNALEAEDWDADHDTWRAARPDLDTQLWEGMGSLLAYERCVAEFAIFFLRLPGWSDRDMPPILVPPVERMTLMGQRPVDTPYADLPKADRNAARALVKQCCDEAHSIQKTTERLYQT